LIGCFLSKSIAALLRCVMLAQNTSLFYLIEWLFSGFDAPMCMFLDEIAFFCELTTFMGKTVALPAKKTESGRGSRKRKPYFIRVFLHLFDPQWP